MNMSQDLALQHKEFSRLKYDGHNRRSIQSSMKKMQHRRSRRSFQSKLRLSVSLW